MAVYVLKRLLAMIPTLFGITFLTFLIITCAPGDPVAMQAGGGGAEGGESQTKKADAMRAKRKLLGMMEAERTLRAWRTEPAAAKEPGRGGRPLLREGTLGDFDAWARSLVLDAPRDRAYVGTQSGRIVALGLATGDEVAAFAAPPFTQPGGQLPAAVWALAVSADGATLAAADQTGRVRLLSTADGRVLAEHAGTGRSVRDLAFLPSGDAVLAAGDDGKIRLLETSTGDVRREYTGHALFVGAVEPALDGRSFYSVGYDRSVRRYDLETGAAQTLGEITAAGNALALSADGTRLAAGGEDRGVEVLDVTGAVPAPVVASFPGKHARAVSAIAFAPDGRRLVSASKDGMIRVWDLASREQVGESPDATSGEVFAIAVAPDGSRFWTASESDRKTPVWKRYVTWVGKLARLDFDRSFIDGERVIDKIGEALPVTMGLSALTIFIVYLVSIPVGVMMAVTRGKGFDRTSSLIVFLLWSMPNFWFATLLIQWFSSRSHFDWFSSFGLKSLEYDRLSYLQRIGDRAEHLVLPMIVFVYASFAGLTQYMRTSMLETIAQDYVRTARAKGLAERVVVFKHALRNSLVTLVTLVGTMLPALIGGSVIIEQIFTIRGMGYLGFNAILERDYPVIMAVTTMSAVLTLVGMLLSDVLYAVVDPRISHR